MAKAPDVGDPAPDFTLPTDGGGEFSLAAHRGEPVVIYFYPKDNTPGCTKEAISFSSEIEAFRSAGISVVGISPDSAASHDKFKTKHDLSVTLVSDEDTKVCEAYGVWAEKSMYGRRFMGVERSTFLIDRDGVIARVWRKVKVPGHVADVLEAARMMAT
ncbi:peroxiredoxin Q/BCP [Rhodopseudomonas julia]|uniref:thioredoxin-dependent peroxiredoxin n=1 Tax=Rhodopseudomonas julia TaxID=200617 RepID=A0ABU0CA21_9BRAD|nr:thioredoxin-dependent thiol peroxidase [Rhodopseudomonas julia]MDQ0327374.1 peroxiredoxin Q/BCP [Rhodopseudomonas julia]